MRRLLVFLALVLIPWAAAVGRTVVVHPFQAQDPVVGVALAERVASSLEGVEVLGPEVAPMLVAPLVVVGGFVNPLALLPAGPHDRSAVALIAGAVGVPVVVSGVLAVEDARLRLDLVASVDGRIRSAALLVDGTDLDALARRTARVVAAWSGATTGTTRPLDLRGPDGDAARARALIGAGFYDQALDALATLEDPHPNDAALRDDLAAALAGSGGAPALAAMVALSFDDPAATARAFARWRAEGGPPVADVWGGAWARSQGDDEAARRAFDAAAAAYPYGVAARATDLAAQGDAAAAAAALASLAGVLEPAAQLGASLAASDLGDLVAEDRALAELGRAAPFLTYAFERRSFLAFDRDDARTAAEALIVAVALDPESDLYWTNLGWAWYLLGFLDRSEAASVRALELDAAQYIARYNLGLARLVTVGLEAALAEYREAIRDDPDVDPEAIADLVVAESRYPAALGIPFALGFVLEAAGDRAGAADAYERYLERVALAPESAGGDGARAQAAEARIAALRAPLPPIEIVGATRLSLGRRGPSVEDARPGDPLTLAFEVSTPGDALPRRLELAVEVLDAAGVVIASDDAIVDVPSGAIGFVIDVLDVELPVDLAEGRYVLEIATFGDGLEARTSREVAVSGAPEQVRRLVGRGLVLTSLDTGQALVGARDLGLDPEVVWRRLQAELVRAAELAEGALPAPETGRFAGMTGGEVFERSEVGDVRDFVDHLLDRGARYATFTFVDAYAQWALDGAP